MSANVDFVAPKRASTVRIYPANVIPADSTYTITSAVTSGNGAAVPVTFTFKRHGDILAIAYTSFTTNGSSTIAGSAPFVTDPNYAIKFWEEIPPNWPALSMPTVNPTLASTLVTLAIISDNSQQTSAQTRWFDIPEGTETTIPSAVVYYSYHANQNYT